MKILKRLSICIAVIIAVSLLIPLAACSGTTAGGSAKGSSDIEISTPSFGFVKAEEYDPDPNTFDFNDSAPAWTALDVDTDYYLFISLTITSRRDNDGQSMLAIDLTFDALNIMDGTMQDVSTGYIQDMTFTDATTGNIGKTTTISFKIPDKSAEPKTIKMIVALKPVTAGESHIIIGYRYDTSGEYKLLGSDGYTKNLKIETVKLETPVLTLTSMGSLSWKNVKNADYYCIYESGQQDPLTDYLGNVIYVKSEGISVGGEMTYNIGEYISGYHNIKIRAFSNNANILQSDYSNSVEYVW